MRSLPYQSSINPPSTAESTAAPALAITLTESDLVVDPLLPLPEVEPEPDVPTSLVGRAVATPWTPPVTPAPVSVGALEPKAMAAAMKLSKVLPVAGALMLPTIPRPQCETCLQWNQMGWVSVTLIVKLDEVTNPESKPAGVLALVLAAKYVHGLAKDDWVTEWGMDAGKKKVTRVPTGAVIFAGLKTNFPLAPTSTPMVPAALVVGAEGTVAAAELVGELAGPGAGAP